MPRFLPAGERARWRVVYDLLRAARCGQVVTYERMGEALGLDPVDDRVAIRSAMRRAALELEVEDKRAAEPVANTGYRVVEPEQHLLLARQQQRRAGRALERGHGKVVHVDFNGMHPELRKAFEVVAGAFTMQLDFNRRLSGRQADLEQAVQAVTEQTEQTEQTRQRTDEQLRELHARLARLEKPHEQ